jgi:hypothetical protein
VFILQRDDGFQHLVNSVLMVVEKFQKKKLEKDSKRFNLIDVLKVSLTNSK